MNDLRRWETFQDVAFIRRVFIVVAIALLVLLLWKLSDVILLAFGAVLVAVVLHFVADADLYRSARLGDGQGAGGQGRRSGVRP